jgi:hypothetical protein
VPCWIRLNGLSNEVKQDQEWYTLVFRNETVNRVDEENLNLPATHAVEQDSCTPFLRHPLPLLKDATTRHESFAPAVPLNTIGSCHNFGQKRGDE